MRVPHAQYLILLISVAIYLYFLLGWVAVVLFVLLVVLALLWWCRWRFGRAESREPSVHKLGEGEFTQQVVANNIARRREQSATLRRLILAIDHSDIDAKHFVNRLTTWQLEYLRKSLIHHTDLYDYLINRAKERLKQATSHSLRHQLRVTIELVRILMRQNGAVDNEAIISFLRDRLE